ncbi:MAG: ATP synthase F0 subunit C [bacterium]|nr:ATP synthase F0 subunit C [bacterium]MDT8396702.1 ATP synthase F0 subunit C [bacterium]
MDPALTVKALYALGAAFAVGFGAVGPGTGMGMSAASAVEGMGTQPKVSSDLFRIMLIGQGATSTPPTFALVIAILLLFGTGETTELIKGFAGLGAGISIGAASFASGLGSSLPASMACEAIARQPHLRRPFTTLMLVGQALSQTPLIFALLVSFLLIFMPSKPDAGFVNYVTVLSAGICMGFGSIGSSIGSGFAAESAIVGIRHHREPEKASGPITRTMLLGLAVAQSPSVFALVISFVLLLAV